MIVVIRADASVTIGTGHLMRCLTLAATLRTMGAECVFLCRAVPGNLTERIRADGFEVVELETADGSDETHGVEKLRLQHADWLGCSWMADAKQCQAVLACRRPDWLIADHYALDYRWESFLRPYCGRLMVIDDLADRRHDCDLLLDQNLVADYANRYEALAPAACVRLLGPHYALLHPQYAELHVRTPPRVGPVRRVLVYFGGADHGNLTSRTIEAVVSLNRPDLHVDIVLPQVSPHTDTIRSLVSGHPHLSLTMGLPSLAGLMVHADLAIGAAGATSWERCCLGLPSIVITVADNQLAIAAELHERRLVRWLGHVGQVNATDIQAALHDAGNANDLEAWSRRCLEVTEGRGAERVAEVLLTGDAGRVRVRHALPKDAHLFVSTSMSAKASPCVESNRTTRSLQDRDEYFSNLRALDTRALYVAETMGGHPIGCISIERVTGAWSISGNWSPIAAWSPTLAESLMQQALRTLRQETPGVLKFGNLVSDLRLSDKSAGKTAGLNTDDCHGLSVSVCTDADSWINQFIPKLILEWMAAGHRCAWSHNADLLSGGDLCFFLSYSRKVTKPIRSLFRNNLVVHESDLPEGKGWSPLTWQILEGKDRIPVTLIEVAERIDSGDIYGQTHIDLCGHEMVEDLRALQAEATLRLCAEFVERYPESAACVRHQHGVESFYRRRTSADSQLNTDESLVNQFNLLRVVDNDRYPAFFEINGSRYVLAVRRIQTNG